MDLGGQSQAVLSYFAGGVRWDEPVASTPASPRKSIWQDERIFPAYVVAISALSLLVHAIVTSNPVRKLRTKWSSGSGTSSGDPVDEDVRTTTPGTTHEGAQQGIKPVESRWIFAFKVVRLVLVIQLFVMSTEAAAKVPWTTYSVALAATLGYCIPLAFLNTFTPAVTSRVFSFHLTMVLLAVFAMYVYRDIWPLMTYTLRPLDEAEGRVLWVKMILAGLAGVVLPLFEPYPYIPYDPKDPFPEPHPEQTASIFVFLTYIFMDSLIYKASRTSHLGFDQLPPLADYDAARNLIKRSYPYLDPFSGAKKGSLFFALVRIFKRPLFYQVIILLLLAMSTMASPIGTNRLLTYLEQEGKDAFVKPWVWILFIAIGPMIFTTLFQLYIFLSVGSLTRIEAIITSLVFDHALRIRIKAETSNAPEVAAVEPAAEATPESDTKASNSPERESSNEDDNDTVHSRATTSASTSTTATSSTTATVVAPSASKAQAQAKAKTADAPKSETKGKDEKDEKGKKNLMGKVNNLITSDLDNITQARDFLFLFLSAPLHVALGMAFLYVVLGWSAFVGLAVMTALVPVPAKVASLMRGVQKNKMKATDARVQTVTEMMGVLRMIKLFGWENRVKGMVSDARDNELKAIWKRKLLGLANNVINHTIPLVHMVVTYATYTLVQKKPLTASIVFSSMTAFNMIRNQMFRVFGMIPWMIQANVSLNRVSDFLRNTELLDEFDEKTSEAAIVDSSATHKNDIGFGKATFSWSSEASDGTLTPSSRAFRLHIDDEVNFKKGVFNLIIGPTGSGKTSMLMALLGEMHYIPSGPESWKSLPREGGVAFAAQESWVQSETIKDNILFGSPYDEERYKKVLHQCALAKDLSLFEAGDATEVGEKGLTLSGGQKARVTLARAVYSSAEIVLLDDVLAALDVHTSRWIVDKCFKGDLLRGRTVLLVTHNVAMAGPLADFVVSLNTDGYIVSQGSVKDALAQDASLAEEIKHEEEAVELDEHEEETSKTTKPAEETKGKLIVAEEIAIGRVSWKALKLFLGGLGGKWTVFWWIQYLGFSGLTELCDVMEMWWLGWWARQYALNDPKSVSIQYYLGIYSAIVMAVVLFHIVSELFYTYGALRASRSIHARLITSLLGSTFRWLDVTPTSRVIARCTQDMQAIDSRLADLLTFLASITLSMLAKLIAVVIFAPTFLLPALAIAAFGAWLGNMYIKAQLSVKREMSNAKSPVLGIMGSAISGLTSIRAYSAQTSFKNQMLYRVDRYVRAARTLYNLNRWVSMRIDALAAIFSAALAFYLIYGPVIYDPSSVGFTLTMAVSFSELILWWVRLYNDFEVESNSLERVHQYVSIEQEEEPKEGGTPPAYWPASGSLEVEGLTARYSADGPKVLQDVSFSIKAGERVGIVGRTGSGKSTLTLSLLRCIHTEGTVVYDGIPTHTLNLDALRSNVTIIPQVPELLSGTLRHNLDVFGQFDDATLNDALRAAGLFSLQRLSDENRMTLDTEIAAGGGNLSVGQRQIIALARAIVRQSKLLILDEATSAIDYETDAVIQESLRTELKKDVTVITVAHRLQTIMDSDKVMVLDAGRLVEFDSPKALLQKEGSLLRALVDESADKEMLHSMAEGKIAAGAPAASSSA